MKHACFCMTALLAFASVAHTVSAQEPVLQRRAGAQGHSAGAARASADQKVIPEVELGWALRDTDRGLVIVGMQAASPAARADLKIDDFFISVNDQPVATKKALFQRLHQHRPGETVKLAVRRGVEVKAIQIALPPDHPALLAGDGAADVHTVRAGAGSDLAELLRRQAAQQELLEALVAEVKALRAEVAALRAGR
jgi:predicted metalloprotease with PDZ domain